MNDQQHLVVPHSIEAEQSVIGALLRNNDAIDRIGGLIADHFYRADHRAVFTEIIRLISSGMPADVMTVWAALEARGGPLLDGLHGYLNQIHQTMPSAANVAQYAKTVVDRSTMRSMLWISDQITEVVHSPAGRTVDEMLDAMQTKVLKLSERRVRNEPRMIRDVAIEFIDGMAKRADGLESAMSTGIPEIDALFNGGLRPGNLVIVAGRPSMGKTALSADIGLNMAVDVSVLMYSMEMAGQEIAGRALANRGKVPLAKIMGKIAGDDDATWGGVSAGCARLDDMRFAIDDTAAITMLDLRMKAKAWKRKHGLGVIIVDYIGLMTGGDGDKRHEQIGYYSRSLKALAKELGVAIIALAQLNRQSEARTDKRPQLSDLRDSGEIEQDADIVILVHRPEMHHPDSPHLKGWAEVMVRKNRSGSLGTINMQFDGPTCRFLPWNGPAPSEPDQRSSSGRRSFDG
ncbi:replicative DNA helicase [Janthinobacterium agaricidamnosum]|nr:replicative DNA helicase [Janthinobacterium agaricidamnosum]